MSLALEEVRPRLKLRRFFKPGGFSDSASGEEEGGVGDADEAALMSLLDIFFHTPLTARPKATKGSSISSADVFDEVVTLRGSSDHVYRSECEDSSGGSGWFRGWSSGRRPPYASIALLRAIIWPRALMPRGVGFLRLRGASSGKGANLTAERGGGVARVVTLKYCTIWPFGVLRVVLKIEVSRPGEDGGGGKLGIIGKGRTAGGPESSESVVGGSAGTGKVKKCDCGGGVAGGSEIVRMLRISVVVVVEGIVSR